MIETLQHITQDLESISHVQQAERACRGGAKWVQVRVKNAPVDKWTAIARDCLAVCRQYNAVCIINDNAHVARAVSAHGVHLGGTDMHPDEARAILGPNVIIGGSANAISDVERLSNTSVNYIGIGPFRFTATKTNLKPVIGLEGLEQLVAGNNGLDRAVPLIAIGGITLDDVEAIMMTGVNGIAVSSAINLSPDPTLATTQFINKLHKYATIKHS